MKEYVSHLFTSHYKQQMIDLLGPLFETDAPNGKCPLCEQVVDGEESWVKHMSIDHNRLMQHVEEDISRHVETAFFDQHLPEEEEEDDEIVYEEEAANAAQVEIAEEDNEDSAAASVMNDDDQGNNGIEEEEGVEGEDWHRCDICGCEGFPDLETFKSHKCDLD